ncbi:hypothetical protein WKI72_14420 [Candidatus Erwinia dacicola]|nr:hypothetical protein [Candidatus Erwinia dacicola]
MPDNASDIHIARQVGQKQSIKHEAGGIKADLPNGASQLCVATDVKLAHLPM